MNKYKKIISLVLLMATLLSLPVWSFADEGDGELLVLGDDLTPSMVEELKKIYGINHPVKELIITNKEEHEALGKYISADIITNKSMSSAYIKRASEGSGISVKTHNINWVTEDMYKNALSTAGVKDADIFVAATFPVSGTAALTGSMKAYEILTGETLSKEVKDVATDEMVTTAELGDSIGEKAAEKIITEVKIFILENNISDRETIEKAIISAAEKAQVSLSDEDMKSITNLMNRISKIEIDVDQIKDQLGNIINKLDKIEVDTEEVKGLLGKIWEALKNFFNNILG